MQLWYLTTLALAVAAAQDACEETNTAEEWLRQRGGRLSKVRMENFAELGNGLAAVDDIQAGDEIIEVPLSSVICETTLIQTGGGAKFIAEFFGPRKTDIATAAFILLERMKGEKSAWKAYLDVLPAHVPVPWLFQEDTLKLLEIPRLESALLDQKASIASMFVKVGDALKAAAQLDGVPSSDQRISASDFLWAFSLVDSRALSIQGKKYLVPIADMFNYKSHPIPRSRSNGNFFLSHHILSKDSFVIKADRDFNKGEQVFMDYGDNSNEIYFRFHGFVADANPFDCIQVYPSEDTDFSRPRSKELRDEFLLKARLPLKPQDCLTWSSARSAWMRSPVRIYDAISSLSEDQLNLCVKNLEKVKSRDQSMKAIASCVDLAQKRATDLVQKLKAMRKGFSTTLQTDLALIETKKDMGYERLVIQFRISQKKMIEDSLSFFESGVIPPNSFGVPRFEEMEKRILDSGVLSREEFEAEINLPLEQKIERLNRWVEENNFPVVNIKAAPIPGLRVGTVATRDLKAEDPYLVVPNAALMDGQTSIKSRVFPFLFHIEQNLGFADSFHHLLLFLLFEYTVEGPRSKWWPYLALLPTPEEMYPPSFFTSDELEPLKGHWLLEDIIENREKILNRHKKVIGFIQGKLGKNIFTDDILSERNYHWAHAILDSRAIWWNGERHLVPLLDMVNCRAGGRRPHQTKIESGVSGAVTRVAEPYTDGEQVFEDYGQPNYIYFQFHGFSLTNNTYNCFRFVRTLTEDQRSRLAKARFGAENAVDRVRSKQTFCLRSPIKENLEFFATFPDGKALLQTALEDFLSVFPTTLEEDRATLAKMGDGKKKNAKVLIVEEKQFATSLLHELKEL